MSEAIWTVEISVWTSCVKLDVHISGDYSSVMKRFDAVPENRNKEGSSAACKLKVIIC
jgi:hypothetical protein